jgi:hypothetical protein
MTATKQELVSDMLRHVMEECTAIDREQRFRDMLDECYSFDSVGGPFAHMSPAKVLEEMDPTAFRCGVNDYMDGEGTVEVGGDDYDGDEVDAAAEEYIDGLRNELADLESQLEDEIAEDEPDSDVIDQLEGEIKTWTEKIEACESYQW